MVHIIPWLIGLLATGGNPTEETLVEVTVLTPRTAVTVAGALIEDEHLWIPARTLPGVTGFERKPEGLCKGDICIPKGDWERRVGEVDYIDVTAAAHLLRQAIVADVERRLFSLSTVPALHETSLLAGEAPDFALLDRTGKTRRLSDFRGRKVFLLTWASW